MLIAIISDIHDNIPNLKKVLNFCRGEKIEKIICCGDLATMETLAYLNQNFAGEIFFTYGNMDQGHIADYDFPDNEYFNTKIFPEIGKHNFGKTRVAFVHYPDVSKRLCETADYDFVFYGHTHKPWTEKIENCIMLNPGNVANQYYPPTFAIWNTNDNQFKLIRINELK